MGEERRFLMLPVNAGLATLGVLAQGLSSAKPSTKRSTHQPARLVSSTRALCGLCFFGEAVRAKEGWTWDQGLKLPAQDMAGMRLEFDKKSAPNPWELTLGSVPRMCVHN